MSCNLLITKDMNRNDINFKMPGGSPDILGCVIADVEIIVAAYHGSTAGYEREAMEADRLQALLKERQARGGHSDIWLVAVHGSMQQERIQLASPAGRFAKYLYTNPQPELSALLNGMETQPRAALGLLDWFWRKCRDLPPTAITRLKSCAQIDETIVTRWLTIVGDRTISAGLEWWIKMDPTAATDDRMIQLRALLAGGQTSVTGTPQEELQRLADWITTLEVPNPERFRQFCAPVCASRFAA